MYHFIIVDNDVNRSQGITHLLDLQGITGDRHVLLLYIIHLLSELKLACGRVGCEYLLEVSPSFFWRFCLANKAKHVIMNA